LTIRYNSCTFKHINVIIKLKCTLCKQTLSNTYLTFIRTMSEYRRSSSRLKKSTKSFLPSTVTSWNNLDHTIKSLAYYGEGSRKLTILSARLRHLCSSLNSDIFRIYITSDPNWQCGSSFEDSIHYIMECPLHQDERYCLSRNQRETHKNIETLLF
jgi:ribosomal protein L33